MTSLKWMFIQESTLTKWPLYVSPDLSSTSCRHTQRQGLPRTASVWLLREGRQLSENAGLQHHASRT